MNQETNIDAMIEALRICLADEDDLDANVPAFRMRDLKKLIAEIDRLRAANTDKLIPAYRRAIYPDGNPNCGIPAPLTQQERMNQLKSALAPVSIPVAVVTGKTVEWIVDAIPGGTLLYAAPPAVSAAVFGVADGGNTAAPLAPTPPDSGEPVLTDKEIDAGIDLTAATRNEQIAFGAGVRWAEKQHGIGTADKAARDVLTDSQRPFNQLTPAEAERLAILAEECGEVVQAVGKVLRHGYESRHPDGGPTNREALERECGDVYYCIWNLIANRDIDGNGMSQRADDKARSIVPYLHHQPEINRLDRAAKEE